MKKQTSTSIICKFTSVNYTSFFLYIDFYQINTWHFTLQNISKSANLQALMLKEGCPPAIKNCSGHFSKFVDPQVHNTLLTDIAHFLALEEEANEHLDVKGKMMAILAELHKALKTHFQGFSSSILCKAKVLSSYMMNGLTFSTFTQHQGNSFILVHHPSIPSIPA